VGLTETVPCGTVSVAASPTISLGLAVGATIWWRSFLGGRMRNIVTAISDHYAGLTAGVGATAATAAAVHSPPPDGAPWWAAWSVSLAVTLIPLLIHLLSKKDKEPNKK